LHKKDYSLYIFGICRFDPIEHVPTYNVNAIEIRDGSGALAPSKSE